MPFNAQRSLIKAIVVIFRVAKLGNVGQGGLSGDFFFFRGGFGVSLFVGGTIEGGFGG